MTSLILGVIEVAYSNEGVSPAPRVTKKGRVHKSDAARIQREQDGHDTDGGPATTVTVALALEERYSVMQVFYDQYADRIGDALVNSAEGALENIFAGSPVADPLAEAGQEIQASFRQFLLSGEIEQLGVEGVPTQASIERKSSRFKSGKADGPRPSFIDTGTYELAMRAWTE